MDIMLDLETLGVRCGSVILSIGACTFDRVTGTHLFTGPKQPTFHRFLRIKEQQLAGCTVDASTFLWWLGQSDQARKAMLNGQDEAGVVEGVLNGLDHWFNVVCPEVPARKVWANGADFDLALLSELYRKWGRQAPWPYNGARDMRTVLDIAGCKAADLIPTSTGAHDALVDAQYQANVVALALKRMARRGTTPFHDGAESQ